MASVVILCAVPPVPVTVYGWPVESCAVVQPFHVLGLSSQVTVTVAPLWTPVSCCDAVSWRDELLRSIACRPDGCLAIKGENMPAVTFHPGTLWFVVDWSPFGVTVGDPMFPFVIGTGVDGPLP